MIKVEGKAGISATVLKHSVSPQGVELLTFELEYPRMVLAELNTHSMLCKNTASSRAIPFGKMKEQLTARPVRFGAANPGMQDKGVEHTEILCVDDCETTAEKAWEWAKYDAVGYSQAFYNAGYHKQVFNRLTEPFQMVKTVVTATEWNNFFWLRNHEAADPTIAELARVMLEAKSQSVPQKLNPGEWHLPYLTSLRSKINGGMYYFLGEPEYNDEICPYDYTNVLCLEDAIKVSTARCAAVSFRNNDYGVEKSREVYERLIGSDRKHASAFQHQGTPVCAKSVYETDMNGRALDGFNLPFNPHTWEPGISHVDREGQLWSAQFRGWIMSRKLIEGENVPG